MASSIIPSDRRPITPPLSAIAESILRSNRPPAASRTTLPLVTSKGIKRRASDELLISAPPKPNSKKQKIVRSSSQPPTALYNRMSRPRDSATPELDEDGLPIRYTPTTGRISKAKKGLPVHHCQYGCGKVYTRAEHRKRHEANHRKDALFKCTGYSDCQKEFQRIDLFQRHLEKQWVPEPQVQAIGKVSTNSHRHGQGTGTSDRTRASSVTSSIGSSDPNSIAEQMAMPNMAAQMGLGLTTPPYSSTFPAYSSMEPQPGQLGWAGAQQVSGISSSSSEAFSDTYSPSLRHASSQMLETGPSSLRTLSASPTGIQGDFGAMAPLNETPGSGTWPSTPYWQQQPMSAATSGFEDAGAVDEHGRSASSHGMEHASGAPAAAGFSSSSAVLLDPRSAGLVELDAEHLQHYHECYWTHFDPLFPIVHRSSYSPASADSGLLGAMILAIGAQFSPRSGAPAHSVNSFKIACSLIDEEVDLSTITNLDPQSLNAVFIAQLQGVFLWEYFAVYRSQHAGVHKSRHFTALYQHLLTTDLASSNDDLTSVGENVQASWLSIESLRRLLLGCFILDTHRSHFFHQAASRPLPPDPKLPSPCSHDLWTAASQAEWHALVTSGRSSPTATPFKINLNHALNLHLSGSVNVSTAELDSAAVSLTAWSLHLASSAPVRSLLIVASEGSYAASNVTEADWTTAKANLRKWVASPGATNNLRAAGRVLTSYFARSEDDEVAGVGLELDWCLYVAALVVWAYTNASEAPSMSPPPGLPAFGKGKQAVGITQGATVGMRITAPPRSIPGPTPPASASAGQLGFLPSQPLGSPAGFASPTQAAGFGVQGPGSPVNTAALQHILQTLNVDDARTLAVLKGCRGSAPLLWAVRSILAEGGLNLMKGRLLAEAEGVLAGLGDVEEGRGSGALLSF